MMAPYRSRILGDDADCDSKRIFDPRPGQCDQPNHRAHILERIARWLNWHLRCHPSVRAAGTATRRQCRTLAADAFIDRKLAARLASVFVVIFTARGLL